MRKRVKRKKLFNLKGATLIGLVLLIAGLAALLVLGPDLVLGQVSAKPGKPDKPPRNREPAFYRISIIPQDGGDNIATGCNEFGYVLAEGGSILSDLHANGTLIDPETNERIPLFMQLLTYVVWTRLYDAGKGLDGFFNGCFGETSGENGYHGALFINFNKKRKVTYISFTWYFDYYTASDVREHFALFSEDIPFPAWTGEDIISETVQGSFDLQYYLNDPNHRPSYESLTGGEGCDFNFKITIKKIIL